MAKTVGIKILVEGGGKASAEVKKLTDALIKTRTEITKQTKVRKELNKRLKEGSISTGEFNKRIAATETRLKAARLQFSKAQKGLLALNGVTKKSSGLFGGLTGSLAKAGLALGGAFAAFQLIKQAATAAFQTIKEFDAEMAKLEAISGAGADALELLEEKALELGKSTRFTATEVAGLETEFAKLGFSTSQILELTEITRNQSDNIIN